jgi:uncharacterized membrane protein YgaE (UPF0421/DUF939 family)
LKFIYMNSLISSPLRVAVAAVLSMALAQALHLPEAYWAPISALVCSLDALEGASITARRRLIGTFFGVVLAAFQVSLTPYNLINYGLAIAVLGLVCSTAKLHTSAFRFGAIALTVVVTAPNHAEVWMTAANRFVDVAVGIVVALLVLLVWPRISET